MKLLRIALREIFYSRRQTLSYVFSLGFGLSCFLTVQSYRTSLQNHIEENKKIILGADLVISSRRHLTTSELDQIKRILPQNTKYRLVRDFFAMLNFNGKSTLVMVRSQDHDFPYYGQMLGKSGSTIQTSDEKHILISEDLANQVQARTQQKVKLGKLELEITDVVTKDESQTFRNISFAPKVYISNSLIESSGLLQFGSTFTESLMLKLDEPSNAISFKKLLYDLLPDPGIQIEASTENTNESSKQLGYLGDFLSLSALTSLLLAGLGASFLFSIFLENRVKDFAILRTLGLQAQQAMTIYWLQGLILSILAILPALIITSGFLPALNHFLKKYIAFDLHAQISTEDIFTIFCISALAGLSISLPHAVRLSRLKVNTLFSSIGASESANKVSDLLLWTPAGFIFWVLALIVTRSFVTSGLYLGFILTTALAIGLISILISQFFVIDFSPLHWTIKYSVRSYLNRKYISMTTVITIGLASFMLNLIPQIKASIEAEIGSTDKRSVPQLFFFDIQDEQLSEIQKIANVQNPSSMIRARISKVNNLAFERSTESAYNTREEEQESRFRNRAVNISIRDKLSPSESIESGTFYSGKSHFEIPEISMEYRYAKRLGIKLNDTVTFDIQGIEITTKLTSLRKVRWTSFQPNFFVIIQPGVLEDVPKTWIASLNFTQDPENLINQINAVAPNISIVNVEKTVAEAIKTLDQMGQSLRFMAFLTIVTGMIILYSVTRIQIRNRRFELNMLKIFGSTQFEITSYLLIEQLLISLIGAVPGAFLSIGGSWVLGTLVFDNAWAIDYVALFTSILVMTMSSVVVGYFSVRTLSHEKPLAILRSSE